MISKTQYKPKTVTHPGFILEEKLEEVGMSQKEFALRTDKPEKTISKIINGSSGVTPETALKFETVLGIAADFWLNLQMKHDESKAREKTVLTSDDAKEWARSLPYSDMASKGWVPRTRKIEDKVRNLLYFFGISSCKAWEDIYINKEVNVAFRVSLAHAKEPGALSAWLRQGQIKASSLHVAQYSAEKFKKAIEESKAIMRQQPTDYFTRLKELCAKAGVKLVYTPCLPKAPVSGCTRWIAEHPVIQLSIRNKRNDKFWFTFYHEAGHILKHGKKEIFLEEAGINEEVNCQKEKEADDFAQKTLLTEQQHSELMKLASLTPSKVSQLACKFEVHPSIILGRLQNERKLDWAVPQEFQNFFVSLEPPSEL